MVLIMNRKNNSLGIDIHTHILPFMDDGADSVEEALEILKQEKEQGITDIVFTPHFRLEEEDIETFLSRRDRAYETLMLAVREEPLLSNLTFYRGAEVWYDPNIIYQDASKLCIENTSYMLLELLPSFPFNLENTIRNIVSKGIIPIIAHVERYPYLIKHPETMESLAELGAVFQCNASTVLSRRQNRVAMRLIKRGLIHVLASDTHNLDYRPPNLAMAYGKLKKSSDYFISNSVNIVNDSLI